MKKNLAKISDPNEGKLKSVLKFASFIFTKPGFDLLKKIVGKSLHRSGVIKKHQIAYSEWIKAKSDSALLKKDFDENFKTISFKPKISIVITLSETQDTRFSATINSIIDQSYTNWELCIVTASTTKQIIKDERIRLIPTPDTAISAACGDYILFMAQGDLLTPYCLFELLKHINICPSDKLIYTDDDIVDNAGQFSTPHFKPGWSPDSLLSRNYIGNTIIIKKELLEQIKVVPEGDNNYDLLLKATELTNNIGHIPKVLVHCHTTVFTDTDNTLSKKAINDALIRRGDSGIVKNITGASGCYSIAYQIKKMEKVSIIIPTKDNAELLKTAVDSILQKTNYPDYEIIVLNNNSTSKEFFDLMKAYREKHPAIFRCLDANFPFNFSKLMNIGVARSDGAYILMCNDDIKVIHHDWMTQMVSYAQHDKTGAIGVKLLYPDNTIQHAGIVLGIDGSAGHILVNKNKDDIGYFNCLRTTTNYSAVTAACMMCRKEVYNKVGGMDESLAVEYNDIDLCLTMLKNGYYNIYLPSVELYHYESATRGHPFRSKASWEKHEKESTIFKNKWKYLIDNDPFYNPNLSLKSTDFRIKPLE